MSRQPKDPKDVHYPPGPRPGVAVETIYDQRPGMPGPFPVKSREELLAEMSQKGLVSDASVAEALGFKMDELEKLSAPHKKWSPPVLGTVDSGEPIDQEVDMTPGSMARRIADVATAQAKHELAKEDTLLSEACELLLNRLRDHEAHAELMLKHQKTLTEENAKLRAQNLRLTDLVLSKLGVSDEDDPDGPKGG